MIHTERQLLRAREQVRKLEEAAHATNVVAHDIDPVILEASRRAVESQVHDLNQEIQDYEHLRRGDVPVPDLSDVAQLHRNLIRARIALGLTQRDLAALLGIAEQQIQRYEANEYAGASLSRLQDIASALGQASGSAPRTSRAAELRAKLRASHLPSSVVDRLVPARTGSPGAFGDFAARAARALGVGVDELLGPQPLSVVPAAPAFKLPADANTEAVAAYATYARHLAEIVALCAKTGDKELPSNPDLLRDKCIEKEGEVSLRALVNVAWDHGVVIIPLTDPGQFHAAFWMIGNRAAVVLKQRSKSEDRWLFDLAHELSHVADHISSHREKPSSVIDIEALADWADDPLEQRANRFAGRVVLGRDAEALATRSAERSNGRVERLKDAVRTVADESGVSAGALANYVSFRLAGQGINWWGAASSLQSTEADPWRTVRDAMLARLDFSDVDSVSIDLLIQAMAE